MKTVVVAGAGSGIGRAVALACADVGYRVVALGRTRASLQATQDQIAQRGARAEYFVADLACERQVEQAFEAVDAVAPGLDVLVNATGLFRYAPVVETTQAAWDDVIASTLTAPFLCAREAFKRMCEARRGRIINIGSTSAQRVRPDAVAYSVAKHAIWGLTQTLALEGRSFNVNCSCINPGRVSVERIHLAGCDEPSMTAAELAQVVLSVCQLPDHINLLDATLMHHGQPFVGRG